MKNEIMRTFNKVGFQLKKHSPEILVVAGVVGTVAAAVMACKATMKVNDILDEHKDEVDTIHKRVEESESSDGECAVENSGKELAIVYLQTGFKLAKLYAPSVILGVTSLSCVVTSNNILRKRNAAITAAYATTLKGFKEYRNRVVERFGDELDKELKYNLKTTEIEETTTDAKGKEKKVKKNVSVVDLSEYSDYARVFERGCPNWEEDHEYNMMNLRANERYANDLLVSRGHLFLNEVYDMLGFPRTKAGQIVGWVHDDKNPIGDNFVDFGCFEAYSENDDTVNGHGKAIILDFNVDGNVWDLM